MCLLWAESCLAQLFIFVWVSNLVGISDMWCSVTVFALGTQALHNDSNLSNCFQQTNKKLNNTYNYAYYNQYNQPHQLSDPMSPWENAAMCVLCVCKQCQVYTHRAIWNNYTSHPQQMKQAPLGPISNKMHHLSNFHQQRTRGVAVRAIQNMKFWPFNYSVPIGPISVSLLNARTQIQTVPSCKMG